MKIALRTAFNDIYECVAGLCPGGGGRSDDPSSNGDPTGNRRTGRCRGSQTSRLTGNWTAHFKKMHEAFLQRGTRRTDRSFCFWGIRSPKDGADEAKRFGQRYYAGMNAANFGIGGDRTQHVLWRIENGELDGISPKVLVLLIGTNNIGYPAEDILRADAKIVQEIHEKLPQDQSADHGDFPRGADPSDPRLPNMRAKIITVNKGLAALDDGNMTRFLDMGTSSMTPDGKITQDFMYDAVALHPNEAGYQLWADAMNPVLTEMLK